VKHDAKVYGEASVGAPPMSVPHGLSAQSMVKSITFGPFAEFSSIFKKWILL
jgi:malate dehydrogenase (quinone)